MGNSIKWTTPAHEDFIRKWAPDLGGFQSNKLFEAFQREFPDVRTTRDSFIMFSRGLKGGSHVVPPSYHRDLSLEVLRLKPHGCLVTSDWQCPFYDHDWASFVFELATAYGVSDHVMNGDVFDFHSLSRFDGQLSAYGVSLERELEIGEAIITASAKRFRTTMDLGNHEWRLFRRVLQADIAAERFARLFESEDRTVAAVTLSAFSYVLIEDAVLGPIRVTHPRNYSVVKTSVATKLAAKYHSHVIAGHGHGIGMARDVSGKYLCIDSGGMFAPNALDYAMSVDSLNPAMSQGAVILTPGHQLILLDPLNLDREYALWVAKRGRTFKREAEQAAA